MISRDRYEKLCSYMKEHEADIANDLINICKIPSVRGESQKEDEPFGFECALCLKSTAEMFSSQGFDTTVFPKSGYALAAGGNLCADKTICLYAHTDVVPANADEWVLTKPFDPKIIGNCIVGRGACDNKDAVVSTLYILKAIRDLKIKTKAKWQIFLGSNEESGMADVKAFAREQKMPDISIVPDAGYPAAIGQKGIWRFNVRSKKAFRDIVTVSGGFAYNIVLDNVSAKLKKSPALLEELMQKAPDFIKIEDGGFITLTAFGKAAHAADAPNGTNALYLLSSFLLDINSLSQHDKQILFTIAESLSDPYGESIGIASESEFFGRTTCASGMARTIDGRLEYTFDVRFGHGIPEDEMLQKAMLFFEERGFEYTEFSRSHGMKRDEDSMPIKTFMEGYRALTGNESAKPFVMGGGTYAYHVDGGFAIGVARRNVLPDIDIQEGHGGAHQADEYVTLPGLVEGAALMAELILEIDDNL